MDTGSTASAPGTACQLLTDAVYQDSVKSSTSDYEVYASYETQANVARRLASTRGLPVENCL